MKEQGIYVIGKSNGVDTNESQKNRGTFYHNLLIQFDGVPAFFPITLTGHQDQPTYPLPSALEAGKEIKVKIKPRVFRGSITGYELVG